MIDRRNICLGAGAAAATGLAAGSARAAPDTPFFVSGPMAHNNLAAGYLTPSTPLVLPDTVLVSTHGPQKLSDLHGQTWLVSLWGEWCAPCLEEATDLAAINRTHGGPSFGVIFVLTNSFKKLDLAGAQAVLGKRGAADAPLLVEAGGKHAVYDALAMRDTPEALRKLVKQDRSASLPCNLLVDRHGQVRARSFGASTSTVKTGLVSGRPLTDADHARILTQHTDWASPIGDEFARALAAGILEKA